MPILRGGAAVTVFVCLAGAYLLSYAFRAINAVIAPSLMADLRLSNADLGLLTSAYLMAFACMQLPLGIWLDKYGARRTEATLLLLAAAGAAIFAMSDSLGGLWLGRALIGAGVSACLMAPFKAYRQWFAPERQSQLISWMLVAGTSGAMSATVPVSLALPLLGWRGVFWLMAGLILLASAAIFVFLKEPEQATSQPPEAAAEPGAKGSYAQVFGDAYFRRMAIVGTVSQGTFIALQTLWAGPWMVTVLGMSKSQASQILLAFNLSLLLAYLALGWWAPRNVTYHGIAGKRGVPVTRMVAIGLLGSLLMQGAIVMSSGAWAWMLWLPFAMFATVATLGQTSVSLAFPASMSGRANSAYNVLLFIGAFAVQWGIGVVIDAYAARGETATHAMRSAFGICIAIQLLGLLCFVASKARPKP